MLEAALAIRGEPPSSTRLVELANQARKVRATRPDDLARVRGDVAKWVRRLAKLGLRPDDVGVRYTARGVASYAARHIAAAVIGLPAAVAGALAYAAPFWLVHAVYLLMKPQLDTAATVKVLASMLFFPLSGARPARRGLVLALGPWPGALVAVALPFCGLYSRHFFDRRQEALRDTAVFGRLLLRRRLTKRLLAERDALRSAIDGLA